jgi:hypothetical protein
MIIFFFLAGLTALGRVSTNYIWMIEMIPAKQKTIVGTFLNFYDTLL